MRIPYRETDCVYEKAHVMIVLVILKLEITKLSYIENVMFWSYYMLSTMGSAGSVCEKEGWYS
jgi:hypothetical protein